MLQNFITKQLIYLTQQNIAFKGFELIKRVNRMTRIMIQIKKKYSNAQMSTFKAEKIISKINGKTSITKLTNQKKNILKETFHLKTKKNS